MKRPKSKEFKKEQRVSEEEEIKLLDSWIQFQKPESGSNPMSLPPLPKNSPVGRLGDNTFSRYAGVVRFDHLPLSKKTKLGLRQAKFVCMTDIQRASLPHALCGRDVLGAAKTGSGKTLAFIIPVLVLDEADRILDSGFKKELNAIISQLPKRRQTFLFSATQTKSVQDLARLSLKDPEYLSVHEESVSATPTLLKQFVMIVPLDQKLDMLWSFIKTHLQSKTLVFLSSCKQVKFVFEAFKKLKPGIPLKCLHGRMKQERRMAIYSEFCEKRSVLFSTDVAARGLDFNKAVDWVVQVDCPENVASYIHRVGRTARYKSGGKSVLFLLPSEVQMLEKLEAAKVPVNFSKPKKELLQPVSSLLASLLVKYPDLQHRGQRAFITYLRSIHLQKDKEIFDVTKLPIEEYSASLGLPMTPKVRFLNRNLKSKAVSTNSSSIEPEGSNKENVLEVVSKDEEIENDLLKEADTSNEVNTKSSEITEIIPATCVSKKKKLKINMHRPLGTRVVFDDEGNTLPPLARIADTQSGKEPLLIDPEQKAEYYKRMREDLKKADKEDKLVERQRLREKRIKRKMKWKEGNEEDDSQDDMSGSEGDERVDRRHKKSKIYFDSDSDDGERNETTGNAGTNAGSITLEEQEALALKLLNSMHS